MKVFVFTLMFFTFFNSFAEEKRSPKQIMQAVDDAPDGESRHSKMTMILINKRGRKRIRSIISYAKDYGKDTKKLMFFEKPADVKGSGFLSYEYDKSDKDDDRWLYLPAMRKTRRISGSSKNDYFMGSDFTYDDMGDRDIDDYSYSVVGEEKCGEALCWIIESTPKKRKDENYSKIISWVRKDAFKIVKSEYYDWDKRLLKIFTVTEIRKHQGFWTNFEMEMVNKQNNHKTLLKLKDVVYDKDVSDSLFNVSTLERGRIR